MPSALQQARSMFYRGEYVEAREALLRISREKPQDARVLFVIGQCYLHAPKDYLSSQQPSLYFGSCPESLRVVENRAPTRETKLAIHYFLLASKANPKMNKAYYWAARAYEEEGDSINAYRYYLKAKCSADDTGVLTDIDKRCRALFKQHKELRTTLPEEFDQEIEKEDCKKLLDSKNGFDRLRALEILLRTDNDILDENLVERVKKLAGKKILSCFIPFGGDSDSRVREKAQLVLRILNA